MKKVHPLAYLLPYVFLLREILIYNGVIHKSYTPNINLDIFIIIGTILFISIVDYFNFGSVDKKCFLNKELILSTVCKIYFFNSLVYFILYYFNFYNNLYLYALSMLGIVLCAYKSLYDNNPCEKIKKN